MTLNDFNNENDDKNTKFEVGDHVRISKYWNIFTKGYTPNWSEEVFMIKTVNNTVAWTKTVNNTVAWTNVISDLNGGEKDQS